MACALRKYAGVDSIIKYKNKEDIHSFLSAGYPLAARATSPRCWQFLPSSELTPPDSASRAHLSQMRVHQSVAEKASPPARRAPSPPLPLGWVSK
jgi:hypothetical protein